MVNNGEYYGLYWFIMGIPNPPTMNMCNYSTIELLKNYTHMYIYNYTHIHIFMYIYNIHT